MDSPRETEAELESFRQQWKAEVSARSRQPQNASSRQDSRSGPTTEPSNDNVPRPKPAARRININEGAEEIEPRAYHDLPDKEVEMRLSAGEQGLIRGASSQEPKSALEHYEQAVEKETQGSLGESLKLYRKAFRLDDRVHEVYKNKHFPPSAFTPKPTQINPSNASVTVPGTGHHSLHGQQNALPPSISELMDDFALLSIPGAPAPTDADPAPPCPIASLPQELVTVILQYSGLTDVASFSQIARVCKRFAYLVMTEEQVWKQIALGKAFGFGGMHYDYACDFLGKPLEEAPFGHVLGDDEELDEPADAISTEVGISKLTAFLLEKQYASSWRQMFRARPRIRFNGCYISTVNYNRPGAASTTQATWGTPVHIVTYFRYLRFFRDGTVISLLTTVEPADVVHHLTRANLHRQHGNVLPSAVMKDALRGRWRLSGPGDGVVSDEAEGDLHIETDGVTPKYMYKMQLGVGSAGRGTRNNKLSWKGFWSQNKLTDDWAEFSLKNDKAYYWSRVKSYSFDC